MMESPSSMSIPGAFNVAQHRDQGSRPRLSGAHSHIFRPPKTRPDSASSSMLLARSTSTNSISSPSTSAGRPGISGTRKRSRTEAEMPRASHEEWSSNMVNSSEAAGAEICPGSPPPLANTRYVLAGGMDTPTIKAAQLALVRDGEYSDIGYRRSLGDDGRRSTEESLYSELHNSGYFDADGLGRDINGRGRVWHSPGNGGWSKTAAQVVGGVVGKVWEFCKNGSAAFRGFHAGGGKGYTINHASPILSYDADESNNFWENEKHTTWGPPDRESTPLPGRFPDEELLEESTKPEIDVPPPKRRQVSKNNPQEEIAKNWVVVQPTTSVITPSKPQTKNPARYAMATSSSASRRPSTTATTSRSASRAGFRPASSAGFSASTAPRRPIVSRVSHAGSPALTPSRGASFASPRSSPNSKLPRPSLMRASPSKSGHKSIDSPAAKEAKRWSAMKKKEERDADESIRRLDQQLKAMIREGREALGTKIEVEMEDDYDSSEGTGNSRKWPI